MALGIKNIRHKIIERWSCSSGRTKLAAKNIAATFVLRFVSILTSLLIVPMTISYLDSAQYGIWLTISSIVGWTTFFDLGLANGFKNRFAECKALGNILLAREYVSVTYAIICIIVTILFTVIAIINNYLDWASILKVDESYMEILKKTFLILTFFLCMNMIANIFVKLLEADQRPALASLISCIGQLFSLFSIYLLTRYSQSSLITLATFFSSVPFLTMAIATILMFNFTRYRKYRPSLKLVNFGLTKNIMGLGLKFFIIYVCLIAVFHLMNIVLSRECGPLSVTKYNVASKYFNIVYMSACIVSAPMWSAFTDAYAQRDFSWMRSMVRRLEQGIGMAIVCCIILLIISPFAYKFWLRNQVDVPILLSAVVMIYTITQIIGSVYMTLINGIGAMYIQFLIYFVFAFISYPLMTVCCKFLGVVGIVIIPSLVYLIQAILARIQILKLINNTATGIWDK